nr:STAS domain-containing protein [Brachymonas sp.]
DSSALAVLLALLRTAQQNDWKWRVLNSFPQFAGLVAIYGLDELLFS